MNLIASATLDWGLGYQNALLYRVSADMRQFRQKTTGKVVVMGMNTLLSMPNQQPLPNRTNIVLAHDPSFEPQGVITVHTLDALLKMLRAYDSERVFIIGGAMLYETMLPYCDRAYITRFYARPQADRFLPDLDKADAWRLTKRSAMQQQDGLLFTYDLYERVRDICM